MLTKSDAHKSRGKDLFNLLLHNLVYISTILGAAAPCSRHIDEKKVIVTFTLKSFIVIALLKAIHVIV